MKGAAVLEDRWSAADYLGALRVRLGLKRNSYRTEPGIYRLGKPGAHSPVLVTANYKLSVDHLRRAVSGLDAWILVLDTGGINVWCAAGKGSFGTAGLVDQIARSGLGGLVEHRRLIVPQLGAPGIDAAAVKRASGFQVVFGPVEAGDLKAFLEGGWKATPRMREKRFPAGERFLVSLTHFCQALPLTLAAAMLFSAADAYLGLHPGVAANITHNVLLALGALFSGSILTGLLLPVLPGRAFSVKSLTPAALFFSGLWFLYYSPAETGLYGAGKLLLFCVWICYQGLNLTGSSTCTSLSGVRKEMRYAVPAMAAALAAAIIGIIYGGFLL